MNKRELLEQANSYYQSNDKKEALIIYLIIVELFPNTNEANDSRQQISEISQELSLDELELQTYKYKANQKKKRDLASGEITLEELYPTNNSSLQYNVNKSDKFEYLAEKLVSYFRIIMGFLFIIILLMLNQTFISPSYTICVTTNHGVANSSLSCEGDFQGERTVSEMYENGWKLITNVGTSVPTWLFEK